MHSTPFTLPQFGFTGDFSLCMYACRLLRDRLYQSSSELSVQSDGISRVHVNMPCLHGRVQGYCALKICRQASNFSGVQNTAKDFTIGLQDHPSVLTALNYKGAVSGCQHLNSSTYKYAVPVSDTYHNTYEVWTQHHLAHCGRDGTILSII